jgi:hypothetical protein
VLDETFGARAELSYRLDDDLTTSHARGWPNEGGIPLEERILLMTVLDLAGAYFGEPPRRRPKTRPYVDGPYPI